MTLYDRVTYDLGHFDLSEVDKNEIEHMFAKGEYMVCTDETADSSARGQILSMLWAFQPDFLAGETGLPAELFSCLQEKLSENCNGTILTLVRSTCGESAFVDAAVSADGRGHFLATYDGDEIEYTTKSSKTVFVYRVN